MDPLPVQIRTLFAPMIPYQASSVLFLIENSDRMASIWPDMRDYCLKPLLSEFDEANRDAPIKVFAVESLPISPNGLPEADRESPAGLHHGLGNVRFNSSPTNRISTANVDAAIDLLSSVTYAGAPISSHLIIVAASAPIDSPFLGIRQYAWFLLAEKLKKQNMYCHLVLARNGENTSSLVGLFDKTRWLEGTVEVRPLIQNVHESRYIFKFAAHPETAYTTPQPARVLESETNPYHGFPLHLPVEAGVSTELFEPYPTPPPNNIPEAGTSYSQGHSSYRYWDYEQEELLKPSSHDPFFACSSTFPESTSSPSPAAWVYPTPPSYEGVDRSDLDVFKDE